MPNQQLIDYIKQARSAGQSDVESKKILQNNGWPKKEIDEAFKESSPVLGLAKNKLPLKKILLISLIGIFVLTMGAGAAYYYYTENTPEIIIKKALTEMEGVKTYHFRADLEITGKIDSLSPVLENNSNNSTLASLFSTISQEQSSKTQNQSVAITIEGDVDSQNEQNPKINLEINLETPKEIDINLKMGLIILDEKFYFKINEVSVPEGQASVDLGEFKDKWIRFDLEELAELSGQEELKKEIERQKQTSQENTEKMRQLLQESEKMFIITKLDDTKIDETKLHHYNIEFDKQKLTNFMLKTIEIYQQTSSQKEEELFSPEQIQQFTEQLMTLLKNPKVELWVGKKDKFIRKALLSFNVKEVMLGIELSFSLEVVLSNFNQPINFTEPEDAKKLKEILEIPLLGAKIKAQDARAENDLRMIQTALEMYYDDNNQHYKDLPDRAAAISPDQKISDYLISVPQNAGNPKNPYYWYDGGDNNTYCVYYEYENTPGTYFYVSFEGSGENDRPACKL